MAQPSTETEPKPQNTGPQEPESSIKTTSKQTIRRESYILGEPDSVPKLLRFINYKNNIDIENISIKDLLITAV
jgi:hypothetical protein